MILTNGDEVAVESASLKEVLRRLEAAIVEHGTQQAFADYQGISRVVISQLLNGRIDPPPKILKALGLRRVILYDDIKTGKRYDGR